MQIKKFLHDSIESLALAKHLLTHIKFCPTIPSLRDGKNDELFIIANGPSLQNDIGGYEDLIASKDVLMMNNAIQTPLFAKLQPKYYVLMDSMYFVGNAYRDLVEDDFHKMRLVFEKTLDMLSALRNNLILLVPSVWKHTLTFSNPYMRVYTYNVFGFRGFEWLEKIVYKNTLSIPSNACVLVPAIVSAIAMGYKRIYLLGCDQNAFLGYCVDNTTNKLSIRDYKHFYKEAKENTHARYESMDMGERLYHDHLIFGAYSQLQKLFGSEYRIFNCSSSSMIDAFPSASLDSVLGGGVNRYLLISFLLLSLYISCTFTKDSKFAHGGVR